MKDANMTNNKVMQDPHWLQGVEWSKDLELNYCCPQRRAVTTKCMRSRLRKLTAPKLIKRQLQEIADQSNLNDTDTSSAMVRKHV